MRKRSRTNTGLRAGLLGNVLVAGWSVLSAPLFADPFDRLMLGGFVGFWLAVVASSLALAYSLRDILQGSRADWFGILLALTPLPVHHVTAFYVAPALVRAGGPPAAASRAAQPSAPAARFAHLRLRALDSPPAPLSLIRWVATAWRDKCAATGVVESYEGDRTRDHYHQLAN